MKWCHPLLLCEDEEKMFLNGTPLVTSQYCDMPTFKSRFQVFICEKAQLKILLDSAQWTDRNQVAHLTF